MTDQLPRTPIGLLISRDLFFTSKVTGTAAALGLQVVAVPDVATAVLRLSADVVRCIFCDLGDPHLDVSALMSGLTSTNRPPANRPNVVAFGSHVATARLQQAREAGCEEVLPRSRFSAELPELLKKHIEG